MEDEKDIYLQILEHLEQWGIDREVDITKLLYDSLANQPSVDPNEAFDSLSSRVVRFGDVMHGNGHITKANQRIRVEGKPDRWEIQARLTILGLQYLNEYRLRKSTLELNETLKANTALQNQLDTAIANNSGIQSTQSSRQTTIFGWTAFFAGVAMVLTGVSLWRDFHKDTQSLLIRQKDSTISTLQKRLYFLECDSSRQIEAKKTSPKKN